MDNKTFKKWAIKQIDKGNDDLVMEAIRKKIKAIYWLSQETENSFSIDGTSYVISIGK